MKRFFTFAHWENKDVDLFIGKLLRYGVILSCIVTTIGGILYVTQHHGLIPDYSPTPFGEEFSGAAEYLRSFSSIFQGVITFDGAAIIQFGVIILIATPILRVAISVFAFLFEKDYLYVGITLIVLAIIVANMILGLH